ncbi:MAG: UDP-N-acetylmuramate--L-alanine ligase [Opitutales bacterium]
MEGTQLTPGARIYLLGIAGTAMGSLAVALQRMGYMVSGADANVYPPMSNVLAAAGIDYREGFDAQALAALSPDCVVVGNAASRGNPEVEWLLDQRAVPFLSMPALIGQTLIGSRPSLVIAGTHGKTTTTALAAHLLRQRGLQPGWMLGGVPLDLPGGCEPGDATSLFVCEGDEYDSAFFDKRSKFIHYRPRVLCLNNLEFDHADIFRDLPDIRRSFEHVCRLVPRSGAILVNGDDPELAQLPETPWCRRFSVGFGDGCDLRIAACAETPAGSRFELRWREQVSTRIEWALHGRFNAANAAMAALGTTLIQGLDPAVHLPAPQDFASFRGVRRRQQVLAESDGVVLMEDFAHHPTAIGHTLEALRAARPKHRLLACFEPRSNTARSAVFQREFAAALTLADEVLLAPVQGGEARVSAAGRLDAARLALDLTSDGTPATACASFEALRDEALRCFDAARADAPLQAVLLTNGSFGGILPDLQNRCTAPKARQA